MSLGVLLNGTLFTRALSIRCKRSMRNLVGYAEVSVTEPEPGQNFMKMGDKMEIVRLDDQSRLLIGFVEKISIRHSVNGHEVSFSGRDKTCDLLDSTLKVKTYTGPISFQDLLKKVIEDQGLSYEIVDRAGQLRQLKQEEITAGEIGQPAMDFLETYARKVSVIMTTTEDGKIMLSKAGATPSGLTLITQRAAGGKSNNVLESSMEINDAERFRDYACQAQIASAGLGLTAEPEETVEQNGTATDSGLRAGRFFEFEPEASMDGLSGQDRATLEANVRRARGFTYSAVIQGAPKAAKINSTIEIIDGVMGIRGTLLIDAVDHQFDLSTGTTTQLECTHKDAYTLNAQADALAQSREDTDETRRAEP